MSYATIEDHIEADKALVDDPTINPAARRHYKEELHDLVEYEEHHHKEIVAGVIIMILIA